MAITDTARAVLAEQRAQLDALLDDVDAAHEDAVGKLRARIRELEQGQQPQPADTVFSFDISNLGDDRARPDKQKIAAHKALFGVDSIQHVRVFFGGAVPRWDDERFQALTEKDSAVVSTLSRDRAAVARFLAATPERFRQRPGQILMAHGHEREANLLTAAALRGWLDGNAELADLLNDAEGYSPDNLIKITLWYSQEQDQRTAVPSREQMYGGQDFGIFGEDVYNPRAAKSYRTAEQMFGPIVTFAKEIGRPCAIPEWGAERKASDPTGHGRAKFITDGGAYLREHGVLFANWWCADGFREGERVLHHLEEHGNDSPEVAAFRALATA